MAQAPKGTTPLTGATYAELIAEQDIPTTKMWGNPDINVIMPNWGSSFPFQLGIIGHTDDSDFAATESGKVVEVAPGVDPTRVGDAFNNKFSEHEVVSGVSRTLAFYTLPFPPQELIVDMPIPTTTYTNIDGSITEIHGGAPFRDITLNGTTGIFPGRGTPDKAKRSDLFESASFIAGGALSNSSAISQAFKGINSDTGVSMYPNVYNDTELSSKLKQTGFFYYQALERFIESYVLAKQYNNRKLIDGKEGTATNLRLVLYVWKEQIAYICSGVRLTKKKSAQSPNEIHYTLQLKAWRRINVLDQAGTPDVNSPSIHTPNTAARVLNRLNAAKDGINEIFRAGTEINASLNSVAGTINTLGDSLLGPAGQAIRLATGTLKSMNAIKYAIEDFDHNTQQSIENHIVRNWKQFSQQLKDLITPEDRFKLETGSMKNGLEADSLANTLSRKNNYLAITNNEQASALKQQNAAIADRANRAEQNRLAIAEQERIDRQKLAASQDASKNLLYKLSEQSRQRVFSVINPESIDLPPQIRRAIFAQQFANLSKTKQDFIQARQQLKSELDTYANKVGLLPTTYANIYKNNYGTSTREANDFDFKYLWSLQNALAAYDTIIASQENPVAAPKSLDYVAGLALRAGVAFKKPIAKIAVPMPYGVTLQQLAYRYLGNANRWHEIVVLNGLRSPYIDEVGFERQILVNGHDNYINVSDKTNLHLNQTIWIKSDTQVQQLRHILAITEISANNYLITLDGEADLDTFTTTDNALIKFYLPGTVNSKQLLFIPSTEQAPPDTVTKDIPGVDMFDPLLQMGGIDLLLTEDNDLVVTSDGDFSLSYGMTNILQSIRILLGTVYGSVLQHPTFGLSIEPGTSTAEVDVASMQSIIKQTLVKERYIQSVNKVQVKKTSNTLQIRVEVVLAGISQILPVEIQVGL
jgi:hypothetical protein